MESLQELEAAFATWHQDKRHPREKTPLLLLVQAREAAKKHGAKAVVQATGIDRQLLGKRFAEMAANDPASAEAAKVQLNSNNTPAFSQMLLNAPMPSGERPLVEVETAAGVKLRVFEHTPELLALLTAEGSEGSPRGRSAETV